MTDPPADIPELPCLHDAGGREVIDLLQRERPRLDAPARKLLDRETLDQREACAEPMVTRCVALSGYP
jgi:hypothetical protein